MTVTGRLIECSIHKECEILLSAWSNLCEMFVVGHICYLNFHSWQLIYLKSSSSRHTNAVSGFTFCSTSSIWRLHSVNFITLKSLSSDHFQFSSVFSSSYLSLCDYHILHCFVFSLKLFLNWLYRPLITINQINKWHNIPQKIKYI
jgi:hypothetical protein